VKLNEGINELVRHYSLEEDKEHIIIPVHGGNRRIFLLKRSFMRLMYQDGHYDDYPLEEVIEATVKYPELLLSEALYLFHKELDDHISEIFKNEKEVS